MRRFHSLMFVLATGMYLVLSARPLQSQQPTFRSSTDLIAVDVQVVDEAGRPLGWMSDRDLAAETVPARPDSTADPVIDTHDVLRDALSDLLQADALYGPVVDSNGQVTGVLSVAIISDFLSSPEKIAQRMA